MTAKEFLENQGIHPKRLIYVYGENEFIALSEIMEDYHKSKTKQMWDDFKIHGNK